MASTKKFVTLKAGEILFPEDKLRDVQDKTKKEYINLKASIEARGILTPIRVVKGEDGYYVNDGIQRVSCATDIDPEMSVPCYVDNDSDMADSIVANVHRIPTKKGDIARQIKRWITPDEKGNTKTLAEVCVLLSSDEVQVLKWLSLNTLTSEMLDKINEGTVTVGNALLLVKASKGPNCATIEEFATLSTQAESMTADDLTEEIARIRDGHKLTQQVQTEGKEPEFKAVEKFRRERSDEMRSKAHAMCEGAEIDGDTLSDYDKGMVETMQYIYNVSESDIATQREAFEEKVAERKAKDKERQEEKARKLQAKADEAKNSL